MTAAGDAVLAVALGEVGYVEGPNNATKYWSWYCGDPSGYGPWCGVFVMWCNAMAGYPMCTDTVLVSNGTWHGYTTGGSGATGVEAQRTPDLQPGDAVLFSWEPWEFRDGVPTCVGEWDGYVAGDHIGIFAYDLGGGRFAAVEGNTSDGSWDNGGMVMLREDRYHSQVCGWWRQENIAGAGPGPTPEPERPKSNEELTDMLIGQDQMTGKIWLISGNTKLEFPQGGGGPGGTGNVYVDEWLRQLQQAYPAGPAPGFVALNPDIVARIPNIYDVMADPAGTQAAIASLDEDT